MPKHTFDTPTEGTFEHITGEFPFEVIAFEAGIQGGTGPTKGSDCIELKCKFFADDTFTKPLAQWTEKLIFHESIGWKINNFTDCANMLIDGRKPKPGEGVDFSEESCIGLRGWAKCEPESSRTDKTKIYNRVKQWLITKPKLAKKNTQPEPADDPGTPIDADNISFD